MNGFHREGVRTVVFHSQGPHHTDAQVEMAAAFLEISAAEVFQIRELCVDGPTRSKQIERWDHDGRRVLRCWHLTN